MQDKGCKIMSDNIKICTKCIYDERVSYIKFDENGVCNYCHQLENLKKEYKTASQEGEERFIRIIEQVLVDDNGKMVLNYDKK